MSTDLSSPTEDLHDETHDSYDDPYDDVVEVRRDGPLSLLVGGTGVAVAVAYLLRAIGSGSALDWVLCLVIGAVGVLHLVSVVDSRAPLMVIDHHGVRVRRGRTWQGVSWSDVDRVEHRPRASLLRDGSLGVVALDGRAISVRLSMSTRLTGSDWHELGDALLELSDGRTTVVQPEPVELPGHVDGPEPARELDAGRRHDVVLDNRPDVAVAEEPAPDADDETSVVLLPTSTPDPSATSTIVIAADDVLATPVDPVVGPVLLAARTRVGLSVDQLAERTRIRPHVIESIELDDFGPCGGDFYARGHLRTLARILGVDVDPLLASYDERYAGAPIDPRRVFEADLAASPGSAGRGRGRLNWSVLVAAVMAVVLVWSVARLVMDAPAPVAEQVVLNGSPGGRAQTGASAAERVTVSFTAATGGARVIVRDARQKVVFDEPLPFMQTGRVEVVPPVRISSTDGGLVVVLDGVDQGAIGASGEDAQRVYVP